MDAKTLKILEKAVSKDETRHIYGHVHADPTTGWLVATDGFRLHWKQSAAANAGCPICKAENYRFPDIAEAIKPAMKTRVAKLTRTEAENLLLLAKAAMPIAKKSRATLQVSLTLDAGKIALHTETGQGEGGMTFDAALTLALPQPANTGLTVYLNVRYLVDALTMTMTATEGGNIIIAAGEKAPVAIYDEAENAGAVVMVMTPPAGGSHW